MESIPGDESEAAHPPPIFPENDDCWMERFVAQRRALAACVSGAGGGEVEDEISCFYLIRTDDSDELEWYYITRDGDGLRSLEAVHEKIASNSGHETADKDSESADASLTPRPPHSAGSASFCIGGSPAASRYTPPRSATSARPDHAAVDEFSSARLDRHRSPPPASLGATTTSGADDAADDHSVASSDTPRSVAREAAKARAAALEHELEDSRGEVSLLRDTLSREMSRCDSARGRGGEVGGCAVLGIADVRAEGVMTRGRPDPTHEPPRKKGTGLAEAMRESPAES